MVPAASRVALEVVKRTVVLIPRLKTTASQPPRDSMALIFSGSFLAGGSTTSPGMGVSGAVSTLRPYCSRTLGLGIESITVAWDRLRGAVGAC